MPRKPQFTLLITAALILTGVLIWSLNRPGSPPPSPTSDSTSTPTAAAKNASLPDTAEPTTLHADREQLTAATQAAPEDEPVDPDTATLSLRVVYAVDESPATDIGIILREAASRSYTPKSHRLRTDASGALHVKGLRPGLLTVYTDRTHLRSDRISLTAGETTEHLLEIREGIDIIGLVVDLQDNPIPQAQVILGDWAGSRPRPVTRADDMGRFTLRQIGKRANLCAWAKGYATSPFHTVAATTGSEVEVTLVLVAAGGSIQGIVRGPEGKVIPDVTVTFGDRSQAIVIELAKGGRGLPPPQIEVTTDRKGEFLVSGLPTGTVPVMVLDPKFAPWRSEVEVLEHATNSIAIDLTPGVTMTGTVKNQKGEPIRDVSIWHGDYSDPLIKRSHSNSDGGYRLSGLPAGELEIEFKSRNRGKTTEAIHAAAGATIERDVTLSKGLVVHGRVLSDTNAVIEKVRVEAYAASIRWFLDVSTNEKGEFELTGCPEGTTMNLQLTKIGFETTHMLEVDAANASNPYEIRMRYLGDPTAHMTGLVLDPAGEPVSSATISFSSNSAGSSRVGRTSATGEFELGPLIPGNYSVIVLADGHPRFHTYDVQLTSDRTTDLGTIRLERGGHVRLVFDGSTPTKEAGVSAGVYRDGTWLESVHYLHKTASRPLAPGEHQLRIRGDSVITHDYPFTIRAGEDTEVRVQVRLGQPVEIQFALPPGSEQVRELEYTIEGPGGYRIDHKKTRWRPHVFRTKRGLSPGTYTVRATSDRGHQGEQAFEVKAAARETQVFTVPLR